MEEKPHHITAGQEINDLKKIEILKDVIPWLFGNGESMIFKKGYTFYDMQKEHPSWNAEEAVYGINRLLGLLERKTEVLHDLGTDCGRLLYFPADHRKSDVPVLLASGGGYYCVGSMTESMPVAARLNELGYDAFCLNYKTGGIGILPQAMEDMAAAVRFLSENTGKYGFLPGKYIAAGFSAGGHLTGMWGTERGWKKYGLPKPETIWLSYPLVNGDIGACAGKSSAWIMRRMMFGLKGGKTQTAEWSLDKKIEASYPDTFLSMAKDDDMIPQQHYEDLKNALKRDRIRHHVLHVERGGHGYGLGDSTDAAGWVGAALAFTKGKEEA